MNLERFLAVGADAGELGGEGRSIQSVAGGWGFRANEKGNNEVVGRWSRGQWRNFLICCDIGISDTTALNKKKFATYFVDGPGAQSKCVQGF